MRKVFFTNRKKVSNFEKVIENLEKNSAIIIREYDLPKKDRKDFAKKIFAIARKRRDLKILIGKDFALARELKADGIHFSDFDKLPLHFLNKKSQPKNFLFSFSCHNFKSLLRAKKLKADMTFLSPIFPTTSHIGAKTFGLRNLAKIAIQNKKRDYIFGDIYALGGITKENLKIIKKLPLRGFGAIDYFSK